MAYASQSGTWLKRNVLAVAFFFASAVMGLLVFYQGRVIDSQRTLIRELFRDSVELNAFKMRQTQSHRH